MSKICPLYSGSTGNSTYIGTKEGSILIDAGASFKGITESLMLADATPQEILAVAVTHEHSDHIKGLKTFLNKTGAFVIASEKTANKLIENGCIPAKTKILTIDSSPVQIGGISINRFETSHDCDGSSGYTFALPDGKRVAICTDLGIITNTVRQAITGSDLVLLESNHDIEMLKRGPYPPALKVRILSDKGHISNIVCANELKNLLQNGTKRFILGHLSRHNNTPLLAKSCAEAALMDLSAKNGKDYLLSVAKPCSNGVTVI
ncbi:MAG: MBL fold metallo-hydrolase [Clostridia bacterium]|nr:MBL fold metallo-hydrolase [Clostridia bacterium]